MVKPEILFLKQEDVIAAGLLDMKQILEVTEYTFKMLGEGKVIQPTKIFMGMPDSENWQSYGMSMPSYVGGDMNICGFKWAAESVYNPTQGMPYGIDVVILSDPKTMYPKAILDGTITTAMRTSAAAGVAAKYTARKDSKIAALIGAGVIGRTMIMAMNEAVPSLEEIRIVDLDISKAEGLVKEFEGKCNVVAYSDAKEAIDGADLVVTETTSRKDFIPKAWITKKNATVIQMEAHAFEEEVFTGADRLFVDSWNQTTHLDGHMMKNLFEKGLVTEEGTKLFQQMATGELKGRESDDEFIVCSSAGMGSVDIAIAYKMYCNAKEKGIGTELSLWDEPLWI